MVTVEDGSGLTMADIIEDQKADTIRPTILAHVLPLMPMTGAVIRSDNAPSYQSLSLEADQQDSLWSKLHLKWELGASYNINKNPISENKIKELEKEILRFKAAGGPLTKLDLIQIVAILNLRVRQHGKSAKELMLRRESMDNKPIDTKDTDVAMTIEENRIANHSAMREHHARRGKKEAAEADFQVGDLVLVRDTLSKHKPREIHTVVEVDSNDNIKIKKFENQLRQKSFDVKPSQLIFYYNYRPGPEQPAGDGEIDLEKAAREHQSPKRQKLDEESDESLENSALNNNIVEISSSSGSDNSSNDARAEITDHVENTERVKPAGKGAPGPSTDQYNKSLRSKRSAAVKASKKVKEWCEMDNLVKVYRSYIHGWDEKHNRRLEEAGDQMIPMNLMTVDDETDDLMGFRNDHERVNDLVNEYQAFLGNHSQSDPHDPTWQPDESEDSDEFIDASMIPNVDTGAEGINSLSLDDTTNPDLEVPPSPPSRTQVQFDIGVESTSTQRPKSLRNTIRRDYQKMNEEGL